MKKIIWDYSHSGHLVMYHSSILSVFQTDNKNCYFFFVWSDRFTFYIYTLPSGILFGKLTIFFYLLALKLRKRSKFSLRTYVCVLGKTRQSKQTKTFWVRFPAFFTSCDFTGSEQNIWIAQQTPLHAPVAGSESKKWDKTNSLLPWP